MHEKLCMDMYKVASVISECSEGYACIAFQAVVWIF